MNLKDRIAVFDHDSKLLQEITKTVPKESEHYQALQRAARALWYVLREGHNFQQNSGDDILVTASENLSGEGERSAN